MTLPDVIRAGSQTRWPAPPGGGGAGLGASVLSRWHGGEALRGVGPPPGARRRGPTRPETSATPDQSVESFPVPTNASPKLPAVAPAGSGEVVSDACFMNGLGARLAPVAQTCQAPLTSR